MVTRSDVEAAQERVLGRARRTPVMRSDIGWLKLEFTQHTGSFKTRGAFNRILAAFESGEFDGGTGIVAASGGNAGLAAAYAARELEVAATVYVPENAPAVKVEKLRELGAEVMLRGREYAEAYEAATKRAADTGALYVHAFDQPDVVAGAGTVALELEDQIGEVDTIVVATGGGGLMAGIAAATDARVVAVEPMDCPTLNRALAAGAPVDVHVSGVAVDSLGARRVGGIAFDAAVRHDVHSVLVPDSAIVDARRWLWKQHRFVVEHGAACALAALTSGAYLPGEDERVAVVLCGANTDPSDLG
ncbi:threonine dehydratase [Actinorhabdospora filicis]|uniref:Threonine dehydratase n=1 Tax=Actinorhabdospora filicis TaxID=1785913 RepID=A0A9W6SGQ6_9ACTN|nr:threonine/serine dehydratase [Actinorhabdospora filicis]GLZ75688.1 threonine dehydratase [Actinorhabdospora filicis]